MFVIACWSIDGYNGALFCSPSTRDISGAALLELDRLRERHRVSFDVSLLGRKEACRQTIIITGESGAGKTESMKIILSELMAVPHGNSCQDEQTKRVSSSYFIVLPTCKRWVMLHIVCVGVASELTHGSVWKC